jgi:Icc-related predicted phosphoesterase
MKSKWDMIPEDTDILITHGPPFGHLDVVKGRTDHLGCEVLTERLKIVKPKIHIFGHIHSGRHIYERDGILFINASVLNEQYKYEYKPITFDFDFDTKMFEIINQ